jgi:hypothetical protein
MPKPESRSYLAYDIENIFGGINVPTKIKEVELAMRSTQIVAITPGVPIMKSTAMSKSFIKHRELDIPSSRIHLGAFRFVKGRDAADLYLIDVLFNNPAVLRSSDIIIASGDKIFMPAVEWLRNNGRRVHLYARKSATSHAAVNMFDSVTWAPEIHMSDLEG